MEMLTGAMSSTVSVPKEAAGCDVFVGVMPIRIPRYSPLPLAAALARADVLHFYTVVQKPYPGSSYLYFDFLPKNPEDPLVAVGALLGQKVPGIVQERNLGRLPARSCWWVGKTGEDRLLESVSKFNSCWDNQLMLFRHDCRHYTDALVGHLTGKTGVIEQVIELKKHDSDPGRES